MTETAFQREQTLHAVARGICRSMFKCTLDDASEQQLWKLTFRLKTRRPKKAATHKPKYMGGPF